MAQRQRILLVEDDPGISDLLGWNLEKAGYQVRLETDGKAGLDAARTDRVDLVLMDLMLPVMDGLAASREIARLRPDLPILMLTARKEHEMVLEGFAAGADDYVTKPFDLEELLARIAARLRRTGRREGDGGRQRRTEVGPLVLDSDAYVLRHAGIEVGVKRKEHDLLALLMSRPGHLFPRDEISSLVWGVEDTESRTLDVHIRHVRVKLEAVGAPVAIRTVHGVGYRLDLLAEAVPAGDAARPA